MSEENKVIARRWWEEIWGKGNLDLIDELLAPDYVFHGPTGGTLDREGYKQDVIAWFTTCVDVQAPIEDIVAEGDKVAVRWAWSGTHTGEGWGVPPTGKRLATRGINIICIAGGKIVEEWEGRDKLGMDQQLGLIPSEYA